MVQLHGNPASGDPFRDRRRTGIGGSDTGGILGVSPFTSALAVWEDKRGLRESEDVPSERMVWGSRLEGAIIAGYAEDTSRRVTRGGRRFRRSTRYPFVIGHPDGESDDGRLVEVKTTAMLDQRWGEDGTADVPPHYYSQVQHYLILTELPVADLLALVGGRELHTFTIPADPTFQEALLVEEEAFWRSVVDGVPPDPDGSESAGAALRRLFPRAIPGEVIATPEVNAYADVYLAAKATLTDAEHAVDRMAQLMQRYMGARERLIGVGWGASWSNRAGSPSWKSVAAEALASIQLIASQDPHHELTGEQAVAAARELVEGWDALVAKHRGDSTRVFTLTKRKATDD